MVFYDEASQKVLYHVFRLMKLELGGSEFYVTGTVKYTLYLVDMSCQCSGWQVCVTGSIFY